MRYFLIGERQRDEQQDDDYDQSQKRQSESYLPADLKTGLLDERLRNTDSARVSYLYESGLHPGFDLVGGV